MKRAVLGFLVLSMLVISSCKKTTTANSWTFKNVTYNTYTTTDAGGGFWDITSLNPAGEMQINFSTSTLPTVSGTYTVVDHNASLTGGNKLNIYLQTSDGITFYSTGGSGNQTVSVSVASNGKVSVSGSGIELGGAVTPSDKSAATINIAEL